MTKLSTQLQDAFTLRASYRKVFDKSDPAQRVLRHLMKTGFILTSPIVAGNHEQTMANVGMQRIVQSILLFICKDDADLRMQIEHAHKQQHDQFEP